jgi:hypothetical protein
MAGRPESSTRGWRGARRALRPLGDLPTIRTRRLESVTRSQRRSRALEAAAERSEEVAHGAREALPTRAASLRSAA